MAGTIRINLDTVGYSRKPTEYYGTIRSNLGKAERIQDVTIPELINAIRAGKTFTPAAMTGTTGDTWQSQQMICIDIDNQTDTAEKNKVRIDNPLMPADAVEIMKAHGIVHTFMYYTFSNTEEWPRYRIVFVLDRQLESADQAADLTKRLVWMFNTARPNCTDAGTGDKARMFLGGRPDCIIFDNTPRRTTVDALQKLPPVEENPAAEGKRSFSQASRGTTSDPVETDIESFDLAAWCDSNLPGKLSRHGSSLYFNPCPICGHNDDFHITGHKYCCHGSNGAGDSLRSGCIIQLLMKVYGLSTAEAYSKFKYDIMRYPHDIPRTDLVPGETVHTIEKADTPMHEDTPAADPGQEQQAAAPAWWISGRQNDTGIIDTRYAADFAKRCGWINAGRVIRSADGKIVGYDEALRAIIDDVQPYCPLVTIQKAKSLFRMTRLYLPEDRTADEMDICAASALDKMELAPMVFNVAQLLPAGLTVLAAPPKTGKSWLCLALADAIATGTKFFGFDTQRGACLYCALEDSRFRIQERLRKIGSSMPENLYVITHGTKHLDNGLLQQLEGWITAEPTAKLIIIDTLARVRPLSTTGLDAYNQDTATIAPLQALALKHGVSIVLVTHYRKTYQAAMDADPFDRITGSNGLLAVADSAWLIYGKRGGEDMTFRTTGRDAMDNELKIEFDKESCRWQIIGTAEAVEEQKKLDAYRASPLAKTIRELVSAAGIWSGTASDLLLAVAKETGETACDPRTIGAAIADIAPMLLKEDGIHFSKAAGGRKGRAYTFQRVK